MLTIKEYEKIKQSEIIACGFAKIKEKDARWIAIKGFGIDWAIYYDEKGSSNEQIIYCGIKLYDKEIIRKLVSCSNRIFDLYRF
jgi:hypothetical protein